MGEVEMFSATIEDLKWCRVEDVLLWLYENEGSDFSTDENIYGLLCNIQHNISLSISKFTASVIDRSAMSIKPSEIDNPINWGSVRYRKNFDDIFCLNFWGIGGNDDFYGSFPMPTNPDPTGQKTEWSREEIDAILETMK